MGGEGKEVVHCCSGLEISFSGGDRDRDRLRLWLRQHGELPREREELLVVLSAATAMAREEEILIPHGPGTRGEEENQTEGLSVA